MLLALLGLGAFVRRNTMIQLRRANERGHVDHGWLNSHHTFSFADYYDPRHMGFRSLRVINDDRVQPGRGFGKHPHRDMEIISYVLEGSLEHKDSLGTGSVIRPGDVQRMSAGTGITHSEFNPSSTQPVHFLQIWLIPKEAGLAPSYEQRHFSEASRNGVLKVVASPDGRDGSVTVHADALLLAGLFRERHSATYALPPGRHAWLHVARGKVSVNGYTLNGGDSMSLIEEGNVTVQGLDVAPGEVLLFDLG
jgi:quercetin 2,3-dioxygenase